MGLTEGADEDDARARQDRARDAPMPNAAIRRSLALRRLDAQAQSAARRIARAEDVSALRHKRIVSLLNPPAAVESSCASAPEPSCARPRQIILQAPAPHGRLSNWIIASLSGLPTTD
jgi:hypothetical protein